jgi:WD40 repeat protein
VIDRNEPNKANSIVPSPGKSLSRVNYSLSVTDKLLAQSKYECFNDFKGETIWSEKAHKGKITQIITTKDCIVSLGSDGICFANKSNGNVINFISSADKSFGCISIYEDNLLVSTTPEPFQGNGSLITFKKNQDYSLTKIAETGSLEWQILDIKSHPENRTFATSGHGFVRIWSLENLRLIKEIRINYNQRAVSAIQFLKGSKDILVMPGRFDGQSLSFLNLLSGEEEFNLKGEPYHYPVTLCQKGSSNIIASGGQDGKVNLWNWETKEHILTILNEEFQYPTYKLGIVKVAYSTNGKYLTIAYDNNSIKIFETKHYKLIAKYKCIINSGKNSPTFDYDDVENAIYSSENDGLISKWN